MLVYQRVDDLFWEKPRSFDDTGGSFDEKTQGSEMPRVFRSEMGEFQVGISMTLKKTWLVGGIATPLKNMNVNWDDYSQYMDK